MSTSSIYTMATPWNDNDNDIWLASTLRLYRNLNSFVFPGQLDQNHRSQALNVIKSAAVNCSLLDNPSFVAAEELSPLQKEYLHEHFLAQEGFHRAHTGEGFVIDSTGSFLGVINVRNHLCLQILDTSSHIENTWNKLVSIELDLGHSLNYSFDKQFGFLTADVHQCGTAFVGQLFLHLPCLLMQDSLLTHTLPLEKEGIAFSSIQGNLEDEVVGSIVTLKNHITIGLTEEEILQQLRSAATTLLMEERKARAELLKNEYSLLCDQVSRSLGLILYSQSLETVEAMHTLSMCKLGVTLGWLHGIEQKDLNHHLLQVRRAHLTHSLEQESAPEDLDCQRSKYLKAAFADVTFSPEEAP